MDQRGKKLAAQSCRKECERQAVGRVVSSRQAAETGVHQTLPCREVSKWKPGMSLGLMS